MKRLICEITDNLAEQRLCDVSVAEQVPLFKGFVEFVKLESKVAANFFNFNFKSYTCNPKRRLADK